MLALRQQGFSRIIYQGQVTKIKDLLKNETKVSNSNIQVVIDRIIINDTDIEARIADSVQTAFFEGNGECNILIQSKKLPFL